MDAKKLETCSRDVISWLPDEVLGKILSLLPTEQAVSTSILSKKWRNVFTLVDNLDVDDFSFSRERDGFRESFMNTLDRILSSQCLIKKLSLTCDVATVDNYCQKACVRRWISNVLEGSVSELCLIIRDRGVHVLPTDQFFLLPQLFASKTLVKLTLGKHISVGKLPSYVSLPSLKTLFINTVLFENDDSFSVLLAGCTVLEELTVIHMDFPQKAPHTLSSPTVKRLSVHYEHPCSSMSFDLPKLVYLDYYKFPSNKYPQINLQSLVEAKLTLRCVRRVNIDITDLILGMRNVEILHLSSSSVNVIYHNRRYDVLVFNNLVKLYFGSRTKQHWKLLPYLLKQSPKLETLIIQNLYSEINGHVFMHLNKVKVLHILSYRGTDQELNNLKSVLEKTESLEAFQVDVTAKDDDGTILQQTKRLLMMRIGVSLPSNCQIKVSHKKSLYSYY